MTGLFKFRKGREPECGAESAERSGPKSLFRLEGPTDCVEKELYSKLREQVPVIDACIGKIKRLVGGINITAVDPQFQPALDRFVKEVRIGSSGRGINTFIDCWLDSLLTYGCALGEMVFSNGKDSLCGVYLAPVGRMEIKEGDKPRTRVYCSYPGAKPIKLKHPENLIFTALSPTSEQPFGTSVLKGLPGLSAVLLRIYDCIGQNFDRVGNVRYAVTYKPSDGSGDRAFAKERAAQIAKEWSNGMSAARNGDIRDFVAVGDVGIKVIGADNQVLDTEIPVRQLLEQLISKLSIPPFLLGLNWSTTERMSAQQADILTSELEYYRRVLEPAVEKICTSALRLMGSADGVKVDWDHIDLMDESELALARLRNAQARKIEISNEKEESKNA